jgi:hypothetical protein
MDEKIILKKSCMPITVSAIPLVEVLLENKKQTFIFDSGAMATVLLDSTTIANFNGKKFAKFGSHSGADRKKKSNRLLTVKMESALFESENKLVTFVDFPSTKCNKTTAFKGILGLDFFFENETSLFLNFSKNEICNIDAAVVKEKVKDKYILLKSECKRNQVFVYLQIEGKEIKFKLDTGYNGSLILPFSEKIDWSNPNKMELDGSLYNTISSATLGAETLYEKMPVTFAGESINTKMSVSTSIKAQNIGMTFIKGFDWIIDYNNNKVYVKRNQNKIESNFNRRVSYYAKANQEKLTIVVKEKSQTKYQLGDEILSVNGQKVTSENNCELQDLLNKTENWDTLSLEVVSNSK